MAFKTPDLPDDERERLAELHALEILDTADEESFDNLTRLAAFICGTPISLISLVDSERQWFKARLGLSLVETPRDVSFCGHAILDPDRLLIVGDATKDVRFRDNPLVTGDPSIRFYAGMPLKTREGSAVGTLCVIDREPRELSSMQHAALVTLSNAVVTQLQLRQRLTRHERFYAMLARAGAAIMRSTDTESLCSEACRVIIELGELQLAWVGRLDTVSGDISPISWSGIEDQCAEPMARCIASDPGERLLAAELVADGYYKVNNHLVMDAFSAPDDVLQNFQLMSSLVIPLEVGGTVWGTLNLYAGQKGFFDAFFLDRARELALDISFAIDRLQKVRDIHYLSFYDTVTGLPNRAGFEEKFLTLAPQIRCGCLLAVGMDQLDQIGAAYGANAIDLIQRELAVRLQAQAPDSAIVAVVRRRLFALFIPEAEPANFSRFVTQRLSHALSAPYIVDDVQFGCPVQLGASFFPNDGKEVEALLTAAERALQSGRNLHQAFRFCNEKIDGSATSQLRLEGELRKAIARGELLNYYQPKVDLATGVIVGVEALLRWSHPLRGLISPAEFIPVLESSGLIVVAGRQVIARAIVDFCSWCDAHVNVPRIAVNVTAQQLREESFLTNIQYDLASSNCSPVALSIELTESSLMSTAESAVAVLQSLRDICILVSIDDFGTGYSSLAYLVTLPIDELKIDRSFVMRMATEPAYLGIVNTIISLAHNLKIKVVAEGVENRAQAELLRLLRCDHAQGYLYSEPVPADVFKSILRTSNQIPRLG